MGTLVKINQSISDKILSNFNVSVVMPFYKKYQVFSKTLTQNAKYFQRNGIEIILSVDEPSEKNEVLNIIKSYPFINWKIIINEVPHKWRSPTKSINVGIKHATKDYILVMGPDSEMATDIIYNFRKMSEYYPSYFFVGKVHFTDYDYVFSLNKQFHMPTLLNYGSILVKKKDLLLIGGYDEEFYEWGGDDDNIRARLEKNGVKKMSLNNCILIHRESKEELETIRLKKHNLNNNKNLRNAFYPQNDKKINLNGWGVDFSNILYDWSNNIYAKELCLKYLQSSVFTKSEVKHEFFKDKSKLIALIVTHNEERHIHDVIKSVEINCDGIILLDDGSTDKTYEQATSKKLILKVKKSRKEFNELENRNILLNLSFFFSSEYYYFMDADERFDKRYCDLYSIVNTFKPETICFFFVHLWDDIDKFRTDIPEKSPIGKPGIIHRWRMFRNIGHMQILSGKIHTKATPYISDKFLANILVLHHGMLEKETRKIKYERYHLLDEDLHLNPTKYDYFKDENVKTELISAITLP